MATEPKKPVPVPPRIERLRRKLIAEIPRFPNDRGSLAHMKQKGLGELLIDYLNWQSRYVGIRPRKVTIEPSAACDPLWAAHQPAIKILLEKVERGEDLTPQLSIQPHTKGYSPQARRQGATAEEVWSDKDFLLNTMGYHHFHLGTQIEPRGHAARTDQIIFARVTRTDFTVVAIFSHDVFEPGSAERNRLMEIGDAIATRNAPPGSVVMSGMIATSGHALHISAYAARCAQLIRDLDPKLDGRQYLDEIHTDGGLPLLPKYKPEWIMRHLDLGIHERAGNTFFLVQKGWS